MSRCLLALVALFVSAASASAYIHFPPMTLPKMCETSSQVRVLKVEKADAEKGVVVFSVEKHLKKGTQGTPVPPEKHLFHTDLKAAKPFLAKLAAGAKVVMFSIEGGRDRPGGCSYVFVDGDCFSADYNADAKGWLFLRPEPQMVKCYKGTVADLIPLVTDTLAGKDVKVPTGEAKFDKAEWQKRFDEINALLTKYRKQ